MVIEVLLFTEAELQSLNPQPISLLQKVEGAVIAGPLLDLTTETEDTYQLFVQATIDGLYKILKNPELTPHIEVYNLVHIINMKSMVSMDKRWKDDVTQEVDVLKVKNHLWHAPKWIRNLILENLVFILKDEKEDDTGDYLLNYLTGGLPLIEDDSLATIIESLEMLIPYYMKKRYLTSQKYLRQVEAYIINLIDWLKQLQVE